MAPNLVSNSCFSGLTIVMLLSLRRKMDLPLPRLNWVLRSTSIFFLPKIKESKASILKSCGFSSRPGVSVIGRSVPQTFCYYSTVIITFKTCSYDEIENMIWILSTFTKQKVAHAVIPTIVHGHKGSIWWNNSVRRSGQYFVYFLANKCA